MEYLPHGHQSGIYRQLGERGARRAGDFLCPFRGAPHSRIAAIQGMERAYTVLEGSKAKGASAIARDRRLAQGRATPGANLLSTHPAEAR